MERITDILQCPSTLLLVLLAGLVFVNFYIKRATCRYPGGPTPLPLLGNLHQIFYCGCLIKFCEKYRRIHGDVFTFEVGGKKRVVISGYDAIKELLMDNGQHTKTRSPASRGKLLTRHYKDTPGMIYASYSSYKRLKSMLIATIKDEGHELEAKMLQELEDCMSHFIEPSLNKPVNIEQCIALATSNIINQLTIGKRFDYCNQTFITLQSSLQEYLRVTIQCGLVSSLPLSDALLGPMVSRFNHHYEHFSLPTISQLLKEVKSNMNVEGPHYVMERFLAHSQRPVEIQYPTYSEANAPYFLFQLLLGASDTTSAALRWAFLFIGSNLEVKLKVQQEIDDELGQDRLPSFNDLQHMPYVEAVLLETLRRGSIGTLSLPYTLTADCVIKGKLIPAGSDLMINFLSVLHDETVFEQPLKFKPERYLTGNIALKKQRTIPFGIGKRSCPGERIARIELFLFLVSILQKYDFTLVGPLDLSYPAIDVGSVCSPSPYDIIFTQR